MVVWVLLSVVIPVVAMIIEDYRERKVRLVWLVVMACCTICCALLLWGLRPTLQNIILNLGLVAYMTGFSMVWLIVKKLKYRRRGEDLHKKRISHYVGSGDAIFLIALTPLFGLKDYLVFLLVAFCLSLLWWGIVRIVRRCNMPIPFISTGGVSLIAYLVVLVL